MIRAISLLGLLFCPALAQTMDAHSCTLGWQAFNEMTGQTPEMTAIEPSVTDDGWCRVDDSSHAVTPKDFRTLRFRATGVEQAVAQMGVPKTVDLRIDGIDLIEGWKLDLPGEYGGPQGRFALRFLREPDTHEAELKELEAVFGALGRLLVTARGGGIDLSSETSMQMTWGGARLTEVMVQLQTTPLLSAGLLNEQTITFLQESVAALPEASIDAPDRAALLSFLEKGPDATGLLRIEARSEKGVGILQMMAGGGWLEEKKPANQSLPDTMDVLFDGVRVSVEWIGVD